MPKLPFAANRPAALPASDQTSGTATPLGALLDSPLRASLVRFVHARAHEWFDIDALMATFGRLRLDVENCLADLVRFGLLQRSATTPARYAAARPADHTACTELDAFLDRRAAITVEDQSPAVQRFREMIGRDEKMLVVFEWIRTAARSDIAVLILGPTGSGKEVVARMIHELSGRAAHHFQAVNCAALPETLFESEIFGYEKGAFTGAVERKPGRVELADGGTLLLDEISDLSLPAQAKLLRVLEERQFERLGGHTPVHVDFRLISASNRPLDELVGDGRFREDLYYRVNAFAIRLPSLRERPVDIGILANRFVARYCAANGLPLDAKTLAPEAIARLQQYSWPGNIRELESTVARAALSSPGRIIRDSDLEFLHPTPEPEEAGGRRIPTLAETERAHIQRVLDAVRWNKKEAARVLAISRGTLYRKIVEYGLEAGSRPRGDAPDLPRPAR